MWKDHDELVVELSRMAREAEAKVRAKMAQAQEGECFRNDLSTMILESAGRAV